METTNTYNADGNLTGTSTPLPGGGYRTTTYTYGNSAEPGDVTAVEDPDTNTTHYSYDHDGDLTAVVDPLGRLTTYTYNVLGQRTAAVSAKDNAALSPSVPGDIYTVAGTDGSLYAPDGVAVDSAGNIYIADDGNNRVREIAATTGTQWGISMTAGGVYTVAGGSYGTGGDGGAATSAGLECPSKVALDSAGNLYIADRCANRVQEVAATTGTQWGISMTADDIYTVAGSSSGTSGDSGDGGAATSALLWNLYGLAFDSTGDLYIADFANNRVQEVAATTHSQWGISMTADDIYTMAGSATRASGTSGDGGASTSALLDSPDGLGFDSAGDLYIADFYNNRVQEVAAATGPQWGIPMTGGDIYTVAGAVAGTSGSAGGGGAATSALLDQPASVNVDSAGDLYITDQANNRVVEVAATTGPQWGTRMTAGYLYPVAAGGSSCGSAVPASTSSCLNAPASVAIGSAGQLYIVDENDNTLRELVAGAVPAASAAPSLPGDIYTVAGADSAFNSPDGVAVDATGNVYVADATNNRVQEIAATTHSQWGMSMTAGDTYTIAGTGTAGHAGDGGAATSAQLSCPSRLALDAAGDLYIADHCNNRVQEIAATTGTQWGQSMTHYDIYTVAGSSSGTSGHTGDGGAATSALLNGPYGLALDGAGDLYIADYANNRVQEVAATTGTQWGTSMTAADIYTVAGSSSGTSGHTGDGGAATSALLSDPAGVGLDSAGDLYIADYGNNRAQEVAASTGTQWGTSMTANDIYTIAGSSSGTSGHSGDNGAATSALLHSPNAVTLDSSGDLYIADGANNRVQEVAAATGPSGA